MMCLLETETSAAVVSTKEIQVLVDRMRRAGATVEVRYDRVPAIMEGRDMIVENVTITDAKGIGPHPMSPIAAAERMRAWLVGREG